ncbi:MAG: potassium channel family protein [Clostridia bacterium]|nr:potassium channel family protein [Clostridia bacterium]
MKGNSFGWVFILLIPVFALIYTLLPEGYIEYSKLPDTFLVNLYYSIGTITTLGYGDITPCNQTAAVLVGLESFLGVVVVGLFLNQMAHKQSLFDSLKAKELLQKRAWARECDKLLQFAGIIKTIENKDELEEALRDFVLNIDLHDWRVLEHICTKYVADKNYESFQNAFRAEIAKIEKDYRNYKETGNLPKEKNADYWG